MPPTFKLIAVLSREVVAEGPSARVMSRLRELRRLNDRRTFVVIRNSDGVQVAYASVEFQP